MPEFAPKTRHRVRRRLFFLFLPVLLAQATARSGEAVSPSPSPPFSRTQDLDDRDPSEEGSVNDFTALDIEELMNIEVKIATRKKQRLSETPAAVYVITQEELRRSGFRSIPEALRMVPGMNVARIDANKWAISIRGFNSRFANKLLVLMDGRSVYTPLFSGVYWDVQDTRLEDIDRIEVIRGPGGSVWGANAVNGVINIITKSAAETQGWSVTGGGGSELGFESLRYGGRVGKDAAFRVWGKYTYHDDFVNADESDASDAWQMGRAGFRLDWELDSEDLLTMQGDMYHGVLGHSQTHPSLVAPFTTTVTKDGRTSGGNLLFRWTRTRSESSEQVFQFYYDRTE